MIKKVWFLGIINLVLPMVVNAFPIYRMYPPCGLADTLTFKDGVLFEHIKEIEENQSLTKEQKKQAYSKLMAREPTDFFEDPEIVKINKLEDHGCNKHGVFPFPVKIGRTSKKAVLQQQGFRGCTAAATAMLIIDLGKKPSKTDIQYRNLGTDDDMYIDIKKAGLIPIQNHIKNLDELKDAINERKSAIVTIDNGTGAHVVIVDEFKTSPSGRKTVQIRDPYHGWEIEVTEKSFKKYWIPGTIMQIASKEKKVKKEKVSIQPENSDPQTGQPNE